MELVLRARVCCVHLRGETMQRSSFWCFGQRCSYRVKCERAVEYHVKYHICPRERFSGHLAGDGQVQAVQIVWLMWQLQLTTLVASKTFYTL